MAKSREEIQDVALSRMDKVWKNNQGERNNRPQKIEEIVKEQERQARLSPEQKVREMSGSEWARGLKEYLDTKEVRLRHGAFNQRFLTWLFNKKKEELKSFHNQGIKFSEMIPWLKDMALEHINL